MTPKDPTDKYPVMEMADIPQKVLELVDKRLGEFQEWQVKRDVDRDVMLAKVGHRTVNVQAGLRILYIIVGGLGLALILH